MNHLAPTLIYGEMLPVTIPNGL